MSEASLPQNRSVPKATVIPVLAYPDVRAAVEWLTEVFGFKERLQITDHRSQMLVGDGAIIVAEYIEADHRPIHGETYSTHQIMVRIADLDAHFKHAKAMAAEIVREPEDHMFGERQYVVRDLGGHRWTFSQTLFDSNPADWGGEAVTLKIP